jgi:hypothetical protein
MELIKLSIRKRLFVFSFVSFKFNLEGLLNLLSYPCK